MIDVHTHISRFAGEDPLDAQRLIARMDALGIARFVVMPLVGPEFAGHAVSVEEVLAAYRAHPGRIIPFCNLDPREGCACDESAVAALLARYRSMGCRGLGEFTPTLYVDDARCMTVYRQCGRLNLPVLFHLSRRIGGTYGVVDGYDLARLERVLAACPDTLFIAHAGFWSNMRTDPYARGPIQGPGRAQELLRRFPNLFGDLSAGSGYGALINQPDRGYAFLEAFQDKLLFGTDICHVDQDAPMVGYLNRAVVDGCVPQQAFEKIGSENLARVLRLQAA